MRITATVRPARRSSSRTVIPEALSRRITSGLERGRDPGSRVVSYDFGMGGLHA